MLQLVSLAQASLHLKRDTSADDADLLLKVRAASAVVISALGSDADFLNSDGVIEVDSDGEPVGVPAMVQQATLLLIGDFYKAGEGSDADVIAGWQNGLPATVAALLNLSGRRPLLA